MYIKYKTVIIWKTLQKMVSFEWFVFFNFANKFQCRKHFNCRKILNYISRNEFTKIF